MGENTKDSGNKESETDSEQSILRTEINFTVYFHLENLKGKDFTNGETEILMRAVSKEEEKKDLAIGNQTTSSLLDSGEQVNRMDMGS